MMIGINNRPYITMDQYFDIDHLNSVREEISHNLEKTTMLNRSFGITNNEKGCYFDAICDNDNHSHVVYLKKPIERISWNNLTDRSLDKKCAEIIENISILPITWDFIRTLPFAQIGRCILFISYDKVFTPPHRDNGELYGVDNCFHGTQPNTINNFIWFNISGEKNFFLLNQDTNVKHYITETSIWFNDMDYHGADPSNGVSISLRVDGIFDRIIS